MTRSMTHDVHVPLDLGRRVVDLPSIGVADDPERCRVLGVSSYAGQALVAFVRLESGALYFDVPLHALGPDAAFVDGYALDEACYRDCPGERVTAARVVPEGELVRVFDRDRRFREHGGYRVSLEWSEHNWLCHVVETRRGIVCWPNFLCLFGHDARDALPDLRKLRGTYSTGRSVD